MKAATLVEPGRIELREVEAPHPGPGQVVVDLRSCGVCATDVKKFTGASKAPYLPFLIGHEPAGIVAETGAGVAADLTPGTRVAVEPVLACGTCPACRSGRVAAEGMGMCARYQVLGSTMDGAFVERLAVPASYVHPIPDSLSFRDAALIEPVAACANGVLRASRLPPGTAVVVGAGFMGLVCVQLFRLLGYRVIASDPVSQRRAQARQLGAWETIDASKEDAAAAVSRLTGDQGAEAVLCAAGGKALTEAALPMVAGGGTLVLLASAGHGTRFEVDLNKLHYDQTWITGSVSYTARTYEWAIDLLSRGLLDTDVLISHVGGLEDTQRLLEMTRDLVGLKKVILLP
jgi:threonine dehydrogenase-like Zn-dependent dehydrogenase